MKKEIGKMRVAHLIYSTSVGGSEMLAANICARLNRDMFEPVILFLYETGGGMPEVLK